MDKERSCINCDRYTYTTSLCPNKDNKVFMRNEGIVPQGYEAIHLNGEFYEELKKIALECGVFVPVKGK